MLVAVLGASPNPERYGHKAVQRLMAAGHQVIPVGPKDALATVPKGVDTLTLYLNPDRLRPLIQEIVALAPKRVIFNPGTESEELATALRAAGIPYLEACTLVLLATGRF